MLIKISLWTCLIFTYYNECFCEGNANYLNNNFNQDQASRSYYPTNFQRFRRGQGTPQFGKGVKIPDGNIQGFGNFRPNEGSLSKGGSRLFNSPKRLPFGGPEAFLKSAETDIASDGETSINRQRPKFSPDSLLKVDREDVIPGDEPIKFNVQRPSYSPNAFLKSAPNQQNPDDEPSKFNFNAKPPFSAFGSMSKSWGNSFGIGKGGMKFNQVRKGSAMSSSKLNMFKNEHPKGLSHNKGSYMSSGSSSGFANMKMMPKGNHNIFQQKGSIGGNFGKFSEGNAEFDFNKNSMFGGKSGFKDFSGKEETDGKTIILGKTSDISQLSENFKDLTGGNVLGSLGNLNADDLKELLRKLEPTTTTKKPNRVIMEEERHKIFSGGSSFQKKKKEVQDFMAKYSKPKGKVENLLKDSYEENQFGESFGQKYSFNQQETKETIGQYDSDMQEKYTFGQEHSKGDTCEDLPSVMNSETRCTGGFGCTISCNPQHAMPNGNTIVFVNCKNGKWVLPDGSEDMLPCQPVCNPECQNDGICISPGICQCADGWSGSRCETEKKMKCANKPPTPMNSRIFCSIDECMARCREGFAFENGKTRLSYECNHGNWQIRSTNLGSEPNCKPVCEDPCQNGGVCIEPDICQCSKDFRGPQCQYPISNCDPTKLSFNGGHECEGKGIEFGCKFICPKGINFTFPPADVYKCNYATGKWTPSNIPACDYSFLQLPYTKPTTVEHKIPEPGVCFAWSNAHYKTFDGIVYSFENNCPYTLLQDSTLGTFSVTLVPDENCSKRPCKRHLNIYTEGDQYTLESLKPHQPSLIYESTSLAIPGQINGLVTERIAHMVVLKFTGLGLTIKWDLEELFIIEVSEQLWNRTSGLCSSLDGNNRNDFGEDEYSDLLSFLQSCEAGTVRDSCESFPKVDLNCPSSRQNKASLFCKQLLYKQEFSSCRKVSDVDSYIKACEWDYCGCNNYDPESCACNSAAAFFKECAVKQGISELKWRSDDFCPMKCERGLEYTSCLPDIHPRCGQPSDSSKPEFCIEGCTCPDDSVMHENICIKPEECPCTYHNKSYSPFDVIPNDCNQCTCASGQWQCTEVNCGSRCSIVGDPHYKTFDGKNFDFMGKCSYYLMKGSDFSIEGENTPCAGAISEAMNFPKSSLHEFPSCTKSVTIRVPGTTVQLKRKETLLNGVELQNLPVYEGGIYIKRISSLFIQVSLPNQIEVIWDGHTRAYIDAPAYMRGKTMGLCGTFNDNQQDDFLTPESDIEQNPIAFANKWKTLESCEDLPLSDATHPCDRHAHRKDLAEKYCVRLMSNVFAKCLLEVNPEAYYKNCLYDMCSCEEKLGECLCPILASYAKDCTEKGIILDWRSQFRECGLRCDHGQTYQSCGSSCSYSCYNIASNPNCKDTCVEGCSCGQGFTLDAENACVPVSSCPCIYDEKEYKPGYEMMQYKNNKKLEICKCSKGRWNCREPTQVEISSPDVYTLPQMSCNESNHQIYTDCMPGEEINCKNMHLRPELPPISCKAGCRCQNGYVRDIDTGKCIKPSQCPCHHGGKSYQLDDTIVEKCGKCTCNGGGWECNQDEDCPGVCSSWGDSHFKTFDGKIYDFHGACDYMLAKGKVSRVDSFEVTIQNVLCGTSGVTCAKAIGLTIGRGNEAEKVVLFKNKLTDKKNLNRTMIRDAGTSVFVEVPDMGLILQWDKGTRAYLTLLPEWKNKVKGLCGNYNDDEKDDFQTPSGGIGETSPKLFGDSWRLQSHCPESLLIQDACSLHPHRKLWSIEKCSILKSKIFSPCHSEVPVEPYLERCQFDSCACDMGGDCHCLCTAISAYAHECNQHSVPIRWRRPDFCPMQCDESCKTYEPCIPSCPKETCENTDSFKSSMCKYETCIEGCAKDVCPLGEVHVSDDDPTCIPKEDCNIICMEIDGKEYYEGDVISEDDCHVCRCLKKEKSCKGVPCPTTPVATLPPDISDCRDGWSVWINNEQPLDGSSEFEPVPYKTPRERNYGYCNKTMMTDIKCRVDQIKGMNAHSRNDVSCSLTSGLICLDSSEVQQSEGYNACEDYEISVLCDCSTIPIVIPTPPVPIPYKCENIWTPWINTNKPSQWGEYELIYEIRQNITFCPDYYIKDVQCKPTGYKESSWTTCDRRGATCSNNGNNECVDYEIRVLCECECQDGLGIEYGNIIADAQMTASSYQNDFPPSYGRLNGKNSWIPRNFPSGNLEEASESLRVDFRKMIQITSIISQGDENIDAYVKEYIVEFSNDSVVWNTIKYGKESNGYNGYVKVFYGNSDSWNIAQNIFAEPVFGRYLQIKPIKYHNKPALRIEATGCDDIPPVEPPPEMPCHYGWTMWMSSFTPAPYDWNDIESMTNLRENYAFCNENQISDVECRVKGSEIPVEKSDQKIVTCNKNGLHCYNKLQADGHCFDYEVRVFCNCAKPVTTTPAIVEELCNETSPTVSNKADCSKFFKCKKVYSTYELVEDDCPPATLFNPVSGVCDWPYNVYKVRPECKEPTITTEVIPKAITTTTPKCEDYWTDWFNVTHPQESGGDYETFSTIRNAGFDICDDSQMLDIECTFLSIEAKSRKSKQRGKKWRRKSSKMRYKTEYSYSIQDWRKSDNRDVTCDIDQGLICSNNDQPRWKNQGLCNDYAIRVLCKCELLSVITTTISPNFTDIRTADPRTTTEFTLNDQGCPPGRHFEEYAIKCAQVCVYYRQLLVTLGKCLEDNDMAPACIDEVSGKACPPGYFLRDNSTCVNIYDCNCVLPNGMSAPPEKTFLVSDCEVCRCKNNNLECATQCHGTTEEIECDKWSPWMSVSTPSGEGDDERIATLRKNNPNICWNPILIQCRDKDTLLTPERLGQNAVCDNKLGLVCYNWQNIEACKDYEVRMICPCKPLTPVPEDEDECVGKEALDKCATKCNKVCHSHLHTLEEQGYCKNPSDCIPACIKEEQVQQVPSWAQKSISKYGEDEKQLCTDREFLSDDGSCVEAEYCNCRLDDGRILMAGKNIQASKCRKCKCSDNELDCYTMQGCEVTTPAVETVPTPSTISPLKALRCNEWTTYINNERNNEGDFQALEDIRILHKDLCQNPLNISCREVKSKLPAEQLGQAMTCDPSIGLICLDANNRQRCYDYEVSFFCECESAPKEPATKPPYEVITEPVPCDGWSPWINENNPYRTESDTEFKTLDQLQDEFSFCQNGYISRIDCQSATSGLGHLSGSKNVRCDIDDGLICLNSDQDDNKVCFDYKIRYFCSCDDITRTTVIIPTTPSPSLCAPEKYIDLLKDVDDTAFTATSSKFPYVPSKSKLLNQEDKGLAWIPNEDAPGKQFLQIDLQNIQPIYGLETDVSSRIYARAGRYKVEISQDDLSWSDVSYQVSEPRTYENTQIVLFEFPVEGRYIKIIPMSPVDFALRLKVIGCSEPTPSPVTTTPKPPLICNDDMGMQNGMMSEFQIEVSSVYDDQLVYYGKENIRLGKKNSPVSAGAWVAKESPNEFVRIDFAQPSKISGVKTQGQDKNDDAVEAFKIRYSPDGNAWTVLSDESGKDKIFPGNYERGTIVTNEFDKILETRFLEIIPVEWNNRIAMRLEIIGCFHPYPEVTTTMKPTTQPPPPYCDACLDLPLEYHKKCTPCKNGQKFNGRNCVPGVLCPCFHDGKITNIGESYETSDCKKCECDLNGLSTCDPIECSPCIEENERPVVTKNCKCLCKPCPEHHKLCPTNDYCLNETKWCDGITHCPDDEVNCIEETLPPGQDISTTTDGRPKLPGDVRTTPHPGCPPPDCEEGWSYKTKSSKSSTRCPEYVCYPPTTTSQAPCYPPQCPFQYIIVMENKKDGEFCPKYKCLPPSTTPGPLTCPPPSCPSGYEPEVITFSGYEQYSQFSQSNDYYNEYDDEDTNCPHYKCVTSSPPILPCPPPHCPPGYDMEYTNKETITSLCPQYTCKRRPTTTSCPLVNCPENLQIMYIDPSDELCPQYSCVKLQTPTQWPPVVTPCPVLLIEDCKPNEELYQINPGHKCPEYSCKKKGTVPSTIPPPPVQNKTILDSCRISSKEVESFDGKHYGVDVCNHILARDKIDKNWQILVHQNCSDNTCHLYAKINQDDISLLILPYLFIKWEGHIYSAYQAKNLGSSKKFDITVVGDSVIYSSKVYDFEVVVNENMDIIIETSPKSHLHIDGLCGHYTGYPEDDLSKPDGGIAATLIEFNYAWLEDGVPCVESDKCTRQESADAFTMCNIIDSDPFTDCHDVLPPIEFVKGCLDRLCQCIKEGKSEQECRCNVLSSYVTACLEKKPGAKLSGWRIATKCYKDCPSQEQYHDCYPYACEKTCNSMMSSDTCHEDPKKACISGCFCQPGLVRKGERCILPEHCLDCVCEGYGNLHYNTYDRFNFSYNGNCSYIATREQDPDGNYKFEVIVENRRCSQETAMMCTSAVKIKYNDHEIYVNSSSDKSVEVIADGEKIRDFPIKIHSAAIEKLQTTHAAIFIDPLGLEVSYNLENHEFTIGVPSSLYFGKLEGLCGNCNGINNDLVLSDGTKYESTPEFVQSWALDPSKSCEIKDDIKCKKPPKDQDPCYKIMDPDIFGKCHPLEDPNPYLETCAQDYCSSGYNDESICESLDAYAKRCSQQGVCLEWRKHICPKNCSEGFEYYSCALGCIKTCENFQELEADPSICKISQTDGCFCKEGMVLEKGKCIPASSCVICDDEGHTMGDIWKPDPCTTCECTGLSGSIICKKKSCPLYPECKYGQQLVEVENTTDECCGPQKICKVVCDDPKMPKTKCETGMAYELKQLTGKLCPEYICVCNHSLCPLIKKPSDDILKNGEIWELDDSGCCAKYIVKCIGVCPKTECPLYYEVKDISRSQDACCPELSCEHPSDACIYEADTYVDPGLLSQTQQSSKFTKSLYKLGEKWKDGPCTECECVETEENPAAKCIAKTCPEIKDHPDVKDYRLEVLEMPGVCCPEVIRTACIEDGDLLKINETYYDPINGCRSVECKVNKEGKIEKIEQMFSCSEDCPLGYKYEPSPLYPQICCGDCKQVACDDDGKLKNVGDKWLSKDFCTQHTCEKSPQTGKIRIISQETQCQEPTADEREIYVYQETKDKEECCSKYEITDCRVNGKILKPGEEIADEEDKCIIYSCEYRDGKVNRKEKEKTCITDCSLGNIYIPPKRDSADCCGKCLQTKCVENDLLHDVGERWKNPDDQCTIYTCEEKNGTLTVIATPTQCPYFDPECPKDKIVTDKTGCCQLCNVTREYKKKCQPEFIPPEETIGLFVYEADALKRCVNKERVSGFKRCSGHCDSGTVFKAKGGSSKHESYCDCCSPSKYSDMKIELSCEVYNFKFTTKFPNVEECECSRCQSKSSKPSKKTSKKPVKGKSRKKGKFMGDQPMIDEDQPMNDQPVEDIDGPLIAELI